MDILKIFGILLCDLNHIMSIFQNLSESERAKCRTIRFQSGETLFHEGDECQGVCLLLQGKVKIRSYSLEGKEIVYNLLGAGDLFGNNLVFASDSTYRGSVVAEEDGSALYIEKKALIEILQSNPKFLVEYLRSQSDFGKKLNARIKLLSLSSPEERLDFYLSLNQGSVTYKSLTSLADELGIKRETLSRLVHKKCRLGELALSPHRLSAPLK